MDLLSFSTAASQQSQQKPTNQGLPLKAVYRDAVVGIRYLHHAGGNGTMVWLVYSGALFLHVVPLHKIFRRFQITFPSTAAASQFIGAIRYVCPCKVNPTPVPTRLETYQQTPGNQTQCTNVPIPYQLPALPNLAAYSQVPRAQTMLPVTSVPSASGSSILLASKRVDPLPVPFLGTTVDTPSRPTTSSSVLPPASTGNSNTAWDTNTPPAIESPTRAQPAAALNSEPLLPASLPASLSDPCPRLSDGDDCDPTLVQPCTTSQSMNTDSQAQYMPAQEISHDTIIASLRESTKLYDLSRVELEKLVGQVVREEGFLKLVSCPFSLLRRHL